MKRLLKKVYGSNANQANKALLTPSEVVQLLLKIDELKNCAISVENSPEGIPQFIVGDYSYQLVDPTV